MSFQKCPVCNGYSNIVPCTVCHGTGLISTITGLPPTRTLVTVAQTTDGTLSQQEKEFKNIARFCLTERLRDPEITLDEIWNNWVNETGL